MNKWFLILFIGFLTLENSTHAQTIDWSVGLTKWYSKPEGIAWLLKSFQPIYDFRPKEKVASIGAGQGIREIVFSLMSDSLTFYLQDLNPYWLEPDRLATAAQIIYKNAGRDACSATFISIPGKKKETELPKQFFDKILVENSLHEFTYQTEILHCIRENLKSDGQLFIWEAIATKPNRRDVDCGKPMFTDESLLTLLTENGYHFIDKTVVNPKGGKDAVFRFRLVDKKP